MSGSTSIEIAGSEATVNHLEGEYRNGIVKDIRLGLTASPRYIPCKYFYDALGSKLFKDICRLPEYYPTRTEMSILHQIAGELMEGFRHRDLVELGAGSNWKIKVLLDVAGRAGRATLRYIPVDISESAIVEATQDLVDLYPELEVLGVVADFTSQIDTLPNERAKMYCFLGGTIGNMNEGEAIEFMSGVSGSMKPNDTLLIGFDMVKSRETLEAAYNDSQGITSQFNKNLLRVVNNELNADFDPACFNHKAFFSKNKSRIEMHLEANRNCSVAIRDMDMHVQFRKGETIHTENSHKYTREVIEDMAGRAGLVIREWYTDSHEWFSLVLMEPENGIGN